MKIRFAVRPYRVKKGFYFYLQGGLEAVDLPYSLNDDGLEWLLTMIHRHVLKDDVTIWYIFDTEIDYEQYSILLHYLIKYAINHPYTKLGTAIANRLPKVLDMEQYFVYNNIGR